MKGIAASPGIAIGRAFISKKTEPEIAKRAIAESELKYELARFYTAVQKAEEELQVIRDNTREKMGEKAAEIFQAHLMFLKDPELIPAIENKIKEEQINAEFATQSVVEEYAKLFAVMEDEYLQTREADIRDVGKRLISILAGKTDEVNRPEKKAIILAPDLSPSDTAQLDRAKVLAFITAKGSTTSHTAIMARSLAIPAVVGVGLDFGKKIKNNDLLIVDGNNGMIFINPEDELICEYKQKLAELAVERKRLATYRKKKARTGDGIPVKVLGNIGNHQEVEAVINHGAEGIGLFRTEFLYMNRDTLPDEEEQYQVYKEVSSKMKDKPVMIRTLDIGGDKELPYLKFPPEMNPFLGYRGIRLWLDHKEIAKSQLRAILRASYDGNIKIIYPMITALNEVKRAHSLLKECKEELTKSGRKYKEETEIGIMIETPAAVMISAILARELDFFSIGTNDLIQYTVAVDRTNEKVAGLHTPYHPAVLKLIKKTVESAHQAGIWVGICGEAAGDKLLLPFLLGAGLDEFSMGAAAIPGIKEVLSQWTRAEASELTMQVLNAAGVTAVKEILKKRMK